MYDKDGRGRWTVDSMEDAVRPTCGMQRGRQAQECKTYPWKQTRSVDHPSSVHRSSASWVNKLSNITCKYLINVLEVDLR